MAPDEYEEMRRRMERFLQRVGGCCGGPGYEAGGAVWSPPTDVFETEEGVVVKMELPGVSEPDVSIVLVGDRLLVKGRRPDPDEGAKTAWHQMEIAYGAFAKLVTIRMPYDRDGIAATLRDGYLRLVIPRSPEPAPERVAVEIRL